MTNLKAKKCKVVEIEIDVNEKVTVEEFALAFLSVYNNVRENKDVFLDMKMIYDSRLFIVIHPEDKESVVDWLKNFSYAWNTDNMRITEVKRTIIDDWDDDFNEDILLVHTGNCKSLDEFEKAE